MRADRQTDRQTNTLITILRTPFGDEVTTISLHMNRRADVACKFNFPVEIEGLLKITVSQLPTL